MGLRFSSLEILLRESVLAYCGFTLRMMEALIGFEMTSVKLLPIICCAVRVFSSRDDTRDDSMYGFNLICFSRASMSASLMSE